MDARRSGRSCLSDMDLPPRHLRSSRVLIQINDSRMGLNSALRCLEWVKRTPRNTKSRADHDIWWLRPPTAFLSKPHRQAVVIGLREECSACPKTSQTVSLRPPSTPPRHPLRTAKSFKFCCLMNSQNLSPGGISCPRHHRQARRDRAKHRRLTTGMDGLQNTRNTRKRASQRNPLQK